MIPKNKCTPTPIYKKKKCKNGNKKIPYPELGLFIKNQFNSIGFKITKLDVLIILYLVAIIVLEHKIVLVCITRLYMPK